MAGIELVSDALGSPEQEGEFFDGEKFAAEGAAASASADSSVKVDATDVRKGFNSWQRYGFCAGIIGFFDRRGGTMRFWSVSEKSTCCRMVSLRRYR